jgi:hypothetical protein
VSLTIYDLSGRQVIRLVEGFKEAGTYKVGWDASGVASGVFFYQLRTSEAILTRKMLVVR